MPAFLFARAHAHDPLVSSTRSVLLAREGVDRRLVRINEQLTIRAAPIAERERVSVNDASYVAVAASSGARLVSCDLNSST
ncbi:MAG: PIN domain-containing protein [Phycicoccus sp.]